MGVAINIAQAVRGAAQAEFNNTTAPNPLEAAEVSAHVDSLGDVPATLSRGITEKTTASRSTRWRVPRSGGTGDLRTDDDLRRLLTTRTGVDFTTVEA